MNRFIQTKAKTQQMHKFGDVHSRMNTHGSRHYLLVIVERSMVSFISQQH